MTEQEPPREPRDTTDRLRQLEREEAQWDDPAPSREDAVPSRR